MAGSVVTVEQVRSFALELPRTTEALVRGRVKFRIGRIVYLAFSRDETLMGFAFPKEEREALVASEPNKFLMPKPSEMRYQWVVVRLATLDADELDPVKQLPVLIGLVSLLAIGALYFVWVRKLPKK